MGSPPPKGKRTVLGHGVPLLAFPEGPHTAVVTFLTKSTVNERHKHQVSFLSRVGSRGHELNFEGQGQALVKDWPISR